MSNEVEKFCAEKNLTRTRRWARLTLAQAHKLYDSSAYQPQVNGVQYQIEFEEPGMFPYDEEDPSTHYKIEIPHVDETAFESAGYTIIDAALPAPDTQRIKHGK